MDMGILMLTLIVIMVFKLVSHLSMICRRYTLRIISLSYAGIFFVIFGGFSFNAWSIEKTINTTCDSSPECYAKNNHNPVRECQRALDEKAAFSYFWSAPLSIPVFTTYLWLDEGKKTIQIFGQHAKVINNFGMIMPLQYFCVFNADTGYIIASSFE
ncbi:hypothetical protein [Serratia sp. D1N4]